MMTDRAVRLCSLRAADGGARLVMNIEITDATGVEKLVLSPLVARLGTLPLVGELTEDALALYREESLFADALSRGYRYLGAADCSPASLRRKLQAAGVSGGLAIQVVEHLMETGLLVERDSALREADRCLAKLWGDRRIMAVLRAKGYGDRTLATVASYLREQESVVRCASLIHKRRMPLPQDEQERARFVASLIRYGYTGREIKAAVQLLKSETRP